jgi:hypothetical protein
MRDRAMVIWCILMITHLKLLGQSKQISWRYLQDMLLLRISPIHITQITLRYIILNRNISLFFK